ncbi:hypothetical protein K6T82_07080 [Flavobacterium sp. 17A]|uniref:Uncharacterized protein n=1 Tax=Flavobacterium potami TaxID=2872310 RepID=A0A9X1KP44_9FLAO|nr:hypothetical protein [Flavobacterium potami]MBZ4034523.1 hypothetical protein [Flavobacterium potami]
MTIQQYIEQISNSKNLVLDQNTDLENNVAKIEGLEFQFEDLFQNQNLNSALLSKIEKMLNLIFIKEELEFNVCFANNDEVRPEYKQSFRLLDLLDYIYAFKYSSKFATTQKIILSPEVEVFWKLVKIGSVLRNDIK